MSKSQQSQTYGAAQGQMAANNSNESSTNTALQSILGTAQNTAGSMLPGITAGYSDISATGGYDPSILGQINSTYGNLATTGGITPDQQQAMKAEASDAARSTYSTAAADAERATRATGGYGVSGSITGSLARQGGQAAGQAVNNATATIAPMIQSGMEAGAAGLGTTQQNLTGNKLAGLTGSTNIYGLNEQQVTSTVSQILQNYQQTGQLNNQDLSVLTNLSNQPGVFDKIVSTIGTLGGAVGGVLGGLGKYNAGSMTPSDERIKEDINKLGEVDEIPIVTFKFKGLPGHHIGTLAQAVEKKHPELVKNLSIKFVDYAGLEKSIVGSHA